MASAVDRARDDFRLKIIEDLRFQIDQVVLRGPKSAI